MSEHTPGPCKAVSRHNGTVNIESPSGAILGYSAKTDRLTHDEVAANARLWATATELLVTLKTYVGIENDRRAGCKIPAEDIAAAHQAAMAALDKAKPGADRS